MASTSHISLTPNLLAEFLAGEADSLQCVFRDGSSARGILGKAATHFYGENSGPKRKALYMKWCNNWQNVRNLFADLVFNRIGERVCTERSRGRKFLKKSSGRPPLRTGHVATIGYDNLELGSKSAVEVESKPYETHTGFGQEAKMSEKDYTKSKSLPDNSKIGSSAKVDLVSVSESNTRNDCLKLGIIRKEGIGKMTEITTLEDETLLADTVKRASSKSLDCLLYEPDKAKFLTGEDFLTLYGGVSDKWLSASAIDAAVDEILAHYPSDKIEYILASVATRLLDEGCNANDSELTKVLKGKTIFLPYNANRSHWILLVADTRSKKLQMYDSLPGNHTEKKENLMKKFTGFVKSRNQWSEEKIDAENWEWGRNVFESLPQRDSHNCGTFVIYNIYLLLTGKRPAVSQFNPESFRKELAQIILRRIHSGNRDESVEASEKPVESTSSTPELSERLSCENYKELASDGTKSHCTESEERTPIVSTSVRTIENNKPTTRGLPTIAPFVPSGKIHSHELSFADEEVTSLKLRTAKTSTPESRTRHKSYSHESAHVNSPLASTRASEISSRRWFSFSSGEKPFEQNVTASNVTPVGSDCRLTDPYEFDIGEIDSVHSDVGRKGIEDFTTESDSTLQEIHHFPPAYSRSKHNQGKNKVKRSKESTVLAQKRTRNTFENFVAAIVVSENDWQVATKDGKFDRKVWVTVLKAIVSKEVGSCQIAVKHSGNVGKNSRGDIVRLTCNVNCMYPNCRKFSLVLVKEDNNKVAGTLWANKTNIDHSGPRKVKQLRDLERLKVQDELRKTNVYQYVRDKIASTVPDVILTSEMQKLRSDETYRKARSQALQQDDLHRDDELDLMLRWREEIKLPYGSRYLRRVGLPVRAEMYSLAQLLILPPKKDFLVHFDATGSVVRNAVGRDDTVYYYACVANVRKTIVPIAEMVTAEHNTASITSFLLYFKIFVLKMLENRWPIFRGVVVDFSLALIHGIMLAFNQMSLNHYLMIVYRQLHNKEKRNPLRRLVCVFLCRNHIQKMVSCNINTYTRDNDLKRLVKETTGIMIRCQRKADLDVAFQSLGRLLLSEHLDAQDVKRYFSDLKTLNDRLAGEGGVAEEVEICSDVHDQDDDPFATEVIGGRVFLDSPFCVDALNTTRQLQMTIALESRGRDWPRNRYFCPGFFINVVVKKLFALEPMWTGLLDKTNKGFSNADAEGHMKIVKKSVLEGRSKLKLGRFIDKVKQNALVTSALLSEGMERREQTRVRTVKQEKTCGNVCKEPTLLYGENEDPEDPQVEEKWRPKKRGKGHFSCRHINKTMEQYNTLPDEISSQLHLPRGTSRKKPGDAKPHNKIISKSARRATNAAKGKARASQQSDVDFSQSESVQPWTGDDINLNESFYAKTTPFMRSCGSLESSGEDVVTNLRKRRKPVVLDVTDDDLSENEDADMLAESPTRGEIICEVDSPRKRRRYRNEGTTEDVRHVHHSPSALSTRPSDGKQSQTTLTERQQTTITADVESRHNKKRARSSSSANRAVKKILTSREFASSAPSSEEDHSKPTYPKRSVAKRPMTPPCIFPEEEVTGLGDKLPIDVVLGHFKFEVDSTNLFETCAENLVALYPNSEAFVFPAGIATHILQSFVVDDQGDVVTCAPDDFKLLAVLGATQIDLSYSKLIFFPHVNVWGLPKEESGAWNLTVIDTVNRKLMNFNASGESPEREPVIMATVARFLWLLADCTPNTAACVHPDALTWLQPKNYIRNKERVFTGSLVLHYMHCFLKGVVINNCDPQSNFPVSLIETLISGVGYRTCSMEDYRYSSDNFSEMSKSTGRRTQIPEKERGRLNLPAILKRSESDSPLTEDEENLLSVELPASHPIQIPADRSDTVKSGLASYNHDFDSTYTSSDAVIIYGSLNRTFSQDDLESIKTSKCELTNGAINFLLHAITRKHEGASYWESDPSSAILNDLHGHNYSIPPISCSVEQLFLPCWSDHKWSVAVVDLKKKTFSEWDPTGSKSSKGITRLKNFQKAIRGSHGKAIKADELRLEKSPRMARNLKEISDSGIYVVEYVRRILEGGMSRMSSLLSSKAHGISDLIREDLVEMCMREKSSCSPLENSYIETITKHLKVPVTKSQNGLVACVEYYLYRGHPFIVGKYGRHEVDSTDYAKLNNTSDSRASWLSGFLIDACVWTFAKESSEKFLVLTCEQGTCVTDGRFTRYDLFTDLRGKVILIPFNILGEHWAVAFADTNSGTVWIMNSLHDSYKHYHKRAYENIFKFIEGWYERLPSCRVNIGSFKILNLRKPQQQEDHSSCGIFVIKYMCDVIRGSQPPEAGMGPFDPIEMRKELAIRLLEHSENMSHRCLYCGGTENRRTIMIMCTFCHRWIHHHPCLSYLDRTEEEVGHEDFTLICRLCEFYTQT